MAIEFKKCGCCEKEFPGTARAKYCCSACRAKAFRRELKEAMKNDSRD